MAGVSAVIVLACVCLCRTRDKPRLVLDLHFILPLYFVRLYCIFILGKDTCERVGHILIDGDSRWKTGAMSRISREARNTVAGFD